MTIAMRAPRRRCLIVTLVAALLLAAPSGASVLCIDSDGHVALEPSRDGIECFDAEPPARAPGAALLGAEDCVDQPIHAQALTCESPRTTAVELWSSAALWLAPTSDARTAFRCRAARAPSPAVSSTTAVLRL